MISPIQRFFGSSDSLDYANRWRSPYAGPHSHSDRRSCSTPREISSPEPPSHNDRKSCSTRREISSPGRGYGCPNIADIVTPPPTISAIPRFFGSSDSLDYANHGRSPHAEPPSHSDRKSCSTRCEISSTATPSITRIAGGAHMRSRPVTAIGSRVQLDARSPPQERLPRLRESLAEPTRGAAQSQRSEVGFNSMRDLLPRLSESLIRPPFRISTQRRSTLPYCLSSDSLDYANRWRNPHAEPPSHSDRKSCSTRREISSPAKELGMTFRTGIGIAYVTKIRNRHSETVDRALVLRNSVLGPKFPPESVSDSLDYANRWRSPHAEPPSHSDRKSCSTRHEISSPGRGYGCPNIADLVTPSAKELGITFRMGSGIAYLTTTPNRHSETIDRAL
ncbi:hypothetical protein Taro_015467, partial [Colocasia esculenta]|nr:hypothetical protein [Colocasia esculenta]